MLSLACQELFKFFQVLFQRSFLQQLFKFITTFSACQELFSFFFRKSGEGGIWTLAPLLTTYSLSRGAPSASLGTSPNCPRFVIFQNNSFRILMLFIQFLSSSPKNLVHYIALSICLSSTFLVFSKTFFSATWRAERVGFEPTRPCGQTVFKTASLWPLRYLSICCCLRSLCSHRRRKWYSSTKVFTCQ